MKVLSRQYSESRSGSESCLQAAVPTVRSGRFPARRQGTCQSLPPQAWTPNAQGERGVALVITLILLAVIAFMAIAFLVLSSRERGAVTTTTDQNIARLSSEAGVEHALQALNTPLTVASNPFAIGTLVSTNYINSAGFVTGLPNGVVNPTNVSYTYPNGTPL